MAQRPVGGCTAGVRRGPASPEGLGPAPHRRSAHRQDLRPTHAQVLFCPLFPLLHVEFERAEIAAALTAALVPTYSPITIDAEPGVLRLWPTPTNGDIADAIEEWFLSDAYDV